MPKSPLSVRKKLGLTLLGLTLLYWVAFPFLPFLEIPHKAIVITVAVIGGEVLFVLAVALLGKEYWGQIKHWFKLMWNRIIQRNRPVPNEENSMNIRRAQTEDFPALLQIWEQSVRATHDFLQEADIQGLIPVVRDQALPNLEVWVMHTEQNEPVGFMGLDGNKLEALFIAPAHFRRGYGKTMLAHARQHAGALEVDVNGLFAFKGVAYF